MEIKIDETYMWLVIVVINMYTKFREKIVIYSCYMKLVRDTNYDPELPVKKLALLLMNVLEAVDRLRDADLGWSKGLFVLS